jgi:Flp pilus assembly protein TadB
MTGVTSPLQKLAIKGSQPAAGNLMERIWIIIACVSAIVGGALLLLGKYDAAFIAGAIGIVAWFLNMRTRFSKETRMRDSIVDSENDRLGEQDAE